MAIRKHLPVNYMIIDLPAPANLSYAWSFGSLLGFMLSIQLITGLLLAMHYSSDISSSFDSVAHIQREIAGGWFLRNLHSNGASFFFIMLYAHMARGLYYGSYQNRQVWYSGVTIYIVSMAVAFMGYLLPWGQMSFWGATVITNLFSAIPYVGSSIVSWLWGGFAVGGPTLNRFFAAHFIVPFLLLLLVLIHLISLHATGSSNPLGVRSVSKSVFHPLYPVKDVVGFIMVGMLLLIVVMFLPNFLGDPDNWSPANSMVTPTHIKPEWYFLWVYAILRSVPNKLGGVLLLVAALGALYFMPVKMGPFKTRFWWLMIVVSLLSWIGASPVEYPYMMIGAMLSFVYFLLLYLFSRDSQM